VAAWCFLVPAVRADEKEVVVGPAIEREVTEYVNYTGRTAASQTVDVRPRVTGYITRVLFKEGGRVKQGDLLYEIDPRPYKAQVDQARGQVDLNQASLELAKANYARDQALARTAGAIGPQQLDKSKAAVDEARARLQASQAALEIYKLNLDFTQIRAPIDGRVGRSLLDAGNLVKADDTLLTTILSVDPMGVYFDMDERGLLRFRKAFPDEKGVAVSMALVGEKGFPHGGQLDFVDVQVNPTTGTLRMRVSFPNPKEEILPGMFARCRVPMSKPYKALLIPEKALLPVVAVEDESAVLVVDDKHEVHQRRVTVGSRIGELRVVREGLKPGDQVIVEGLKKIKPGEVVKPRRTPRPEEPKPKQPE
jgi:multidrug efflux system membrane fusion protein